MDRGYLVIVDIIAIVLSVGLAHLVEFLPPVRRLKARIDRIVAEGKARDE